MKKINSLFGGIWKYCLRHKILSPIILIIAIVIGYYGYKHFFPTIVAPSYTLAQVHKGSIIQTVTGTGQVSAQNQLDVTSQVSGTILSIPVSVGQHVSTGDLIASIDSTNAAVSLDSAKLAYAKLTEPAKPTDIANAQNSLNSAYLSGYNNVSSAFLDLPNIMSGMKDLLYGQTGFLSDQKSSYLISTARDYRNTAGVSYDKAVNEYATVLDEYRNTNQSSATSSIDKLLSDTYGLLKDVATSLQNTQNTITYITTYQPDYDSKDATTASANVNTWSSTMNTDVNNVFSSQNSITSNETTLSNLIIGADPLDVQSQLLSVQQAQNTYNNYFIRAPFDGVIARIPVNVYDQAGGSSVIATIVGDQKMATLSLDEVDAANVKVGDPVSLTFNAINNFTATGTVSEVDLVGTVSSGVVSYGVKVLINTTDNRINPGMSVNATITTNEIDNVLIVPSSAIKTQGNTNYVQTLDKSVVFPGSNNISPNNLSNSAYSSTSSGTFRSTTNSSTTRKYQGLYSGNSSGLSRAFTISTNVTPTNTAVTTGVSDNTNTEIINGLQPGEFVITKTVTNGTTQTAFAPSILSSLGARGGGPKVGGGGFRSGN